MVNLVLDKKVFAADLHRLYEVFDLLAPCMQRGVASFASVRPDEFPLDFPRLPEFSVKSLFFPQQETLLYFQQPQKGEAGSCFEPQGLIRPRLVFGVRPCDAQAMQRLDAVFLQDKNTPDVYWRQKRDMTLLVGVACQKPGPGCFCSAVGGSPHGTQGLDVLLVDLGESYLVAHQSERAKMLWPTLAVADPAQQAKAAMLLANAQSCLDEEALPLSALLRSDVLRACESGIWEQLAESCLQCGICSYVCPSCHCFDMQDVAVPEGSFRRRVWDCCMNPRFTLQASGKNPRTAKSQRLRQRFLHKLKYPAMRGQDLGCVGCGRCVQLCPVNIDIRSVARHLESDLGLAQHGVADV